jgi:hypothetical protein
MKGKFEGTKYRKNPLKAIWKKMTRDKGVVECLLRFEKNQKLQV